MCGICGSIRFDGGPVDPGPVRAMLAGMVHRGPDAEGLLAAPGLAAGIRRLAVIDVAGGDQPIANEDGAVRVVFNGEIYNFAELRDDLESRGHRFRTRSDTEVLVHLWEEHGPALLDRLNGMFAFCLHDRRSGEIFLARDRLGIKPLFYRMRADGLDFASETAVLLRHPEVEATVDAAALIELFCLQYLSGEQTVWSGVRKLLPGHAIHVRNGEARVMRWYDPPAPEMRHEADAAELADELRDLLTSSVRYRRVCDVPLGVFLSGGLDSSVITALLASMVDRPVETFAVGFEGDAAFDERRFASLTSGEYGTRHHELVVSPLQIAEFLPRMIEHLEEPVMDPAILPTYLLSEFARRRVTVVLTGEGADELFGGYRRYAYQERYGWLSRMPGVRQAGRGPLEGLLPRRMEQALEAVAEPEPARNHLRWSATIGPAVARRLFGPSAYDAFESRTADRFASHFDGAEIRLADQLRCDQHEWLPHNLLAKVDRASMAHSLEARVPFLDHRIVEWAATVPDALKIRGGIGKALLRDAFAERLPAEILERPKRGFDLPLAAWIRGPLRPMVSDLMSPAHLRRWDGLDAAALDEMRAVHLEGKQDFGLPLFNALSILLFLERAA